MENTDNTISFNELIETLHENGMMYLYLVSLISADTLISVENCDKSIHQLKLIMDNLPSSNIPDDKKSEYLDYCKDGLLICERDKKNLENIN